MEKLKFFIAGVVFIGSLFVAYKSGQSSGPYISIDKSFSNVAKVSTTNTTEKDTTPGIAKYSYISAYSHIYAFNGRPVEMAVTLSLQNLDRNNELKINKVLYHNTKGELIREYLSEGYLLNPLETKEIFILDKDLEGGSGANFIVEYILNTNAIDGKFESIMTSGGSGKSYVFDSVGRNFVVPKSN